MSDKNIKNQVSIELFKKIKDKFAQVEEEKIANKGKYIPEQTWLQKELSNMAEKYTNILIEDTMNIKNDDKYIFGYATKLARVGIKPLGFHKIKLVLVKIARLFENKITQDQTDEINREFVHQNIQKFGLSIIVKPTKSTVNSDIQISEITKTLFQQFKNSFEKMLIEEVENEHKTIKGYTRIQKKFFNLAEKIGRHLIEEVIKETDSEIYSLLKNNPEILIADIENYQQINDRFFDPTIVPINHSMEENINHDSELKNIQENMTRRIIHNGLLLIIPPANKKTKALITNKFKSLHAR